MHFKGAKKWLRGAGRIDAGPLHLNNVDLTETYEMAFTFLPYEAIHGRVKYMELISRGYYMYIG